MRTAALVLAAAALPAQVFIVDVNNGPGTNFVSLPVAVAAVPDGAVLRVRPGSYQPFTLVGKGLVVLGDPGANIVAATAATCAVSGLPAGRVFAMRGMTGGGSSTPLRLDLQSCQGPVLIDGMMGNCQIVASQCDQLALSGCDFEDFAATPARFVGCDTVVTGSFFAATVQAHAIEVVGGRMQIGNSTAFGGGPSGSGLAMTNADLRMAFHSALTGSGAYDISGTGTVRRDPYASLGGSPPSVAPGVLMTVAAQPLALAYGGALGGNASCNFFGPSGAVGGMFLGEIAAPVVLPGFVDRVWIDPTTAIPIGVYVMGGLVTIQATVPNNLALLGRVFGWQGVVFEPTGVNSLSVPGPFTPW
ncbi:MAG TPA: hypothetical protein VFZ65_01430 [Planctomycetota bacterium]|nr:hypothetical protein [Planctomycetota bacterium]